MIYSEEWLKNAIDKGYFKSYDYSEFSVHEQIGEGGFGTTTQRFVKELKNLQKVCKHPNIIEFYGVTRDQGSYIMIFTPKIFYGRPPFKSLNPYAIIIHVSQGGREKPIEGTPDSYIQIYERCWNYDPNQRPELKEIQESLLNLLRKENFGTSKFDKFISDSTPKISNSEIPLSINSNNDYKKILEQSLKFIDDLFMEYFLNAIAGIWNLQRLSHDVKRRGIGLFIQILINLSHDLCCMTFFFYQKKICCITKKRLAL
ncbi:calmodulin-dependent protein kinase [Gigaspora margarita]|uniref:Calmodulin-dependent protein kinase n=1 Tax=Gigaspora margarita TaxID=4874 RepID=A0A8H3XK03_GIGMA|nr:calmodulin-dependent protein kinase [Gigaspora margarita]